MSFLVLQSSLSLLKRRVGRFPFLCLTGWSVIVAFPGHILTAKKRRGYQYNKIRRAVSKFCPRHSKSIMELV